MLHLIPLAALIGAALSASRLFRQPVVLTLLPTICCIVVSLFLFGLAGWLATGAVLIAVAGILGLIWVSRQRLLELVTDPATIICVVIVTFIWGLNRDSILIAWDEFSHWGTITKFLVSENAFPTTPSDVLFPDYPYGSALFFYFLSAGSANETVWILGASLIKIAALSPLLAGLRWRDAVLFPALILLIIFVPYVFSIGAGWDNLLVDGQLALIAAAAAVLYFRSNGESPSRLLLVLPVFAVLPLIKDTGLIFGLVAWALLVVDQVIRSIRHRVFLRAEFAYSATALSLLIVARQLWKLQLDRINSGSTFELSGARIVQRIHDPEFGATVAAVFDRFIEMFTIAPPGPAQATIPIWIAAIGIMAVIATALTKERWAAAVIVVTQLVLVAAFFTYLAVLIATYLFSFTAYEAAQLASFHRYVGTFLLMWVVITAAQISKSKDASRWRHYASAIALSIAVGFATHGIHAPLYEGGRFQPRESSVHMDRDMVLAALGGTQDHLPEGARVFSVWNNSTGQPFYITLYELIPHSGNRWCFGLGAKRYEGDVWSCDLSPEGLISTFELGDISLWTSLGFGTTRPAGTEEDPYDFLFLGAADQIFWDTYSEIFAPGAEQSGSHWFSLKSRPDGSKQFVPFVGAAEPS